MSKQLLIIRHGKSDWDDINLSDFQRPLNARGTRNAPEMARRLLKKNIHPQQLVSSPAARAISTANYFADELGIDRSAIIKEAGIYEAFPSDLLEIITNFNNNFGLVALFGHNPGLTYLVRDLCDVSLYNIPTCGIVLIEFPIDDWKMVSSGTGKLIFFDYPKKGDD